MCTLAAGSEEVDHRLGRRAAFRADDRSDEDAGAAAVVGERGWALRHRNRQPLDAGPAADRVARKPAALPASLADRSSPSCSSQRASSNEARPAPTADSRPSSARRRRRRCAARPQAWPWLPRPRPSLCGLWPPLTDPAVLCYIGALPPSQQQSTPDDRQDPERPRADRALCPFPDRLPAYRRGAHGAVQLALRQGPRRQDAAAHRGHRPRAPDAGRRRRHPRWAQVAGARLDRRARIAVRPGQAPPRGGRGAARPRSRLPLLPDDRRARRHAQGGRGREAPARDPQPLARPRPRRGPQGAALRDPAQGAARGRDRDRRSGAGPRRVRQQGARRPHHPAQRRHPYLQSRRRRRRPRHGDHARHPRRRPSDQRRAPGADLCRHGLGGCRSSRTCR